MAGEATVYNRYKISDNSGLPRGCATGWKASIKADNGKSSQLFSNLKKVFLLVSSDYGPRLFLLARVKLSYADKTWSPLEPLNPGALMEADVL